MWRLDVSTSLLQACVPRRGAFLVPPQPTPASLGRPARGLAYSWWQPEINLAGPEDSWPGDSRIARRLGRLVRSRQAARRSADNTSRRAACICVRTAVSRRCATPPFRVASGLSRVRSNPRQADAIWRVCRLVMESPLLAVARRGESPSLAAARRPKADILGRDEARDLCDETIRD